MGRNRKKRKLAKLKKKNIPLIDIGNNLIKEKKDSDMNIKNFKYSIGKILAGNVIIRKPNFI